MGPSLTGAGTHGSGGGASSGDCEDFSTSIHRFVQQGLFNNRSYWQIVVSRIVRLQAVPYIRRKWRTCTAGGWRRLVRQNISGAPDTSTFNMSAQSDIRPRRWA
jgi:hypothetical protein